MSNSQITDPAEPTDSVEAKTVSRAERKQPIGLFALSSIEMWERFSFYGLQVILAYYIYYSAADGGLGLSEGEALAITGAYGGAVYLGQPIGAWFADRLIPARTMAMAGGIIIMAGHITLAAVPGITGLIVGLVLITIGTGALTPNVYTMVGRLYKE
ncbi:MFS transporter, partial [Brevibacterium metallidurans]